MKKYVSIFMLLTGFALTSCYDVPEPYLADGEGLPEEEEYIVVEPSGSGTVADPYNVAGLLKAVANLKSDEQTETELVVKGIVCSIKEFNADNGNFTFYISDNGKTTSDQFYIYRAKKGANSENFTSEDQVKIGDRVVVQGFVTNYNGTIETAWASNGKNAKVIETSNTSSGESGTTVDILGDVIFFEESLDGKQGDFTLNNVQLPEGSTRVWATDATNHCMKASGYVSGKTLACEGWLISPVINLKKATEAYLTFDHYCNKFNVDASTQCSVLIKPENEQEWTELPVEDWPTAKFVTVANVNISHFIGSKVQIAYRYTSNTSSAGTWEIKNVKVTGFGEKGYNGLTWEDFSNGYFDQWDDATGLPLGWQENTTIGNATVSPSEDSYSRLYAVCITGTLAISRFAYRELGFEPGSYTFSFYAKAATQAGGSVKAGYTTVQDGGSVTYAKEETGSGADKVLQLYNNEWTRYDFTFTVEEQKALILVIAIPTKSKGKDVLVDDVTLTKNN